MARYSRWAGIYANVGWLHWVPIMVRYSRWAGIYANVEWLA